MASRKLYVFRHAGEFGNAPSHKLFDLVKVSRKGDTGLPARGFENYDVRLEGKVPDGVEVVEML